MIIDKNSKEELYEQIDKEIEELKQYKIAYQQKMRIYLKSSKNINEKISNDYEFQDIKYLNSINDQIFSSIKNINKQIKKINKKISFLYRLKNECNIEKLRTDIEKYNEDYKNIKNNFIKNSVYEDGVVLDYIEKIEKKVDEDTKVKKEDEDTKTEIKEKIEDNPILLISEIQNCVILPYTGSEVEEILKNSNNEYKTEQEVVDNVFTRKLETYRDTFAARFKEAYELATKRDNYSNMDGIKLGIELFGKRYLHPAIISACRNTDELDVYLDCLDKNELNEFKIFDIKYELHPIVVGNKENKIYLYTSLWKKIINFTKKVFSKKLPEKNEE